MKTKLFFCAIISSIFVSLFLASCGPSSTDLERKKQNDSIKPIAESIIKDVAVIKDTFVGNKDTKFIIFEELHTSIKGQIEIAIMLNRLYEKYKLRNIALEGLFSNKEFNTKWFHEMDTYKYPSLKNETAVQILSEGEISSAEFMSLVYSDLSVFGTENEKDYNVEISESASSAVYPYLFAIAEKSAGQDIIIVFNKLIKENKNKEAIETLLNSNPFTKEKYKLLSNQDTILSIEATIEIYENIKKEAEKVEAKIDAKTDKELNEAIEFDKTAARRSDTMVKYCIEKPIRLSLKILR